MYFLINKLKKKTKEQTKPEHTVITYSDDPILSTYFSDSFSSSLKLTSQDLAFLTESNGPILSVYLSYTSVVNETCLYAR